MAKYTKLDYDLEWDLANSAPVQGRLEAIAVGGAAIGKTLAAIYSDDGDLVEGVHVAEEMVFRGKKPVKDRLVVFEHEYMAAIEYGHSMRGYYNPDGKPRHVMGIHVVRDTYKMMGG